MPFYIYAWIASLTAGVLVVTNKLTGKYAVKNPWVFCFLLQLSVLIFQIPAAMYFGATFPQDIFPIAAAGLFGALFWGFYLYSLFKADITTISPLFNIRLIFTLILTALFLGERLYGIQLFYSFLIIVMGWVVTLDERLNPKSFLKKSVLYMLLAMFFLTLNDISMNRALVKNSLWTGTVWAQLFTAVFLIPVILKYKKDIRNVTKNNCAIILLNAFMQIIIALTLNSALKENVSITTLIMTVPVSSLLTMLISIIKPSLLEKHSWKIYALRFSAAMVMIYSALQLSK